MLALNIWELNPYLNIFNSQIHNISITNYQVNDVISKMVEIILFQQCSDSVICSEQLDALEADTFPAKVVHEQQTPEA